MNVSLTLVWHQREQAVADSFERKVKSVSALNKLFVGSLIADECTRKKKLMRPEYKF